MIHRTLGLAAAILAGAALTTLPALAGTAAAGVESPEAAESYKLPITPPLDQGDSGLCWIYSTLSMLETNYLVRHPGSTLRLSRAALQRASILDRFQRDITGNSTHFEDGGIAVDALRLARQQGLVSAEDGGEIVEETDPVFKDVAARIRRMDGADARLKALDAALAPHFRAPPGRTRLDGRPVTPQDMAQAVIGDRVWREYDLTPQAVGPRTGRATDPDARPETMVTYIDLATAVRLIHDSLKRGEAVVWGSNDDHALLIYGADYDAAGRPLAYWVKDSFAPYTRQVAAEEVHKALTDVTVTDAPAPRESAAAN